MNMLNMSSLFTTVQNPTIISITYSICLSFLLSSLVAMIYQKTFQDLSYSRNYIQAIILASIVATIAMQAIGDNLARGLGMMGALAIVRFRSSLKDPKDMIFVFMALTVGIACGVYSFSIATIGTLGLSLFAYIIHSLPFSKDSHFDGLLRFNLSNDPADKSKLDGLLASSCEKFALVTLREVGQGSRLDYAYQVKLNKNKKYEEFVSNLQKIESIKGVNFLLQESTVEI